MSEQFTRSVTVKRPTKKTSGYKVYEEDGDYFIGEVPSKARVNVGDKVVGINGIKADEFIDDDDANALIESIRIVAVPEDEIEDYEAALAEEEEGEEEEESEEESEEEEYEEYDRGRGKPAAKPAAKAKAKAKDDGKKGKKKGAKETALALVPAKKNTTVCNHCDHENEDLEEDEEGDLVCENCGHVIEVDKARVCKDCGHENHNLEPDEDGDYVCEECGAVIPDEDAANEKKKSEYHCPDCSHITVNPVPDDEGDRICEECGCILSEKVLCNCEECGFENVDPEPNEDGEFMCEKCGAKLPLEAEKGKSGAEKLKEKADAANKNADADGQEFGGDGKPTTNPEGKKLTPADMFNPGDVITVTVGKSNPRQDAGLKLEEKAKGKYYVRKVPSSGLFAKTPVKAGDKVLEVNGTDYHEFKTLNDLKKVIKDEMRITIVVLRKDPDDSDSSASSVDYDNLDPVTPDGVARQEIEERDDDTVGYDGKDCGCAWCPDCHG